MTPTSTVNALTKLVQARRSLAPSSSRGRSCPQQGQRSCLRSCLPRVKSASMRKRRFASAMTLPPISSDKSNPEAGGPRNAPRQPPGVASTNERVSSDASPSTACRKIIVYLGHVSLPLSLEELLPPPRSTPRVQKTPQPFYRPPTGCRSPYPPRLR